jgi:hypothetical protein
MKSSDTLKIIGVIIVAAIVLQVIFVFAESNTNTPDQAAIKFSKAYFKLQPCMADLLCDELQNEDADIVGDYIYRVTQEGAERGLKAKIMKYKLYHIETKTKLINDNEAEVHLMAAKRVAINSVFAWIAKLFQMGKTHEVEDTLTLIKEDGQWKVCGEPFTLSETT